MRSNFRNLSVIISALPIVLALAISTEAVAAPHRISRPGAPRSVHATPESGMVTLKWSKPISNGGSMITKYVATSHPANKPCETTGTQCSIAGLHNGTTYTFTVVAINRVGVGVASRSSNPVTPGSGPVSTTIPTPAPITLSGSGQNATNAFTVTSGLAIFQASCSNCQGNFIVEIDHANGSLIDIPINVIGAYSGSVAEGLSAGQYVLSVTADQGVAWSVQITQPRGVAGIALPTTLSGQGQEVVGPVAGGSSLRIQASNSSVQGGNFIVEVISASGSMQALPFNEIGSFNGSTIANFLNNGPYYLEIDSDGTWSLQLSPG